MTEDNKAVGLAGPGEPLSDRLELYYRILKAAPNPIVVVDEEGRIVLVNQATEDLFGYSTSELVEKPVEMLVPSGLRDAHIRARAEFTENPSTRPMGKNRDLRAVMRDGSERPVEIGLSPLQTPEGKTVTVCALVDLAQRMRMEEELRRAADRLTERIEELQELVITDMLTSLKTRDAFMEHLVIQLELAARNARALSVLILDIDRFKDYNDTFGHLAGDEVLKRMGGILKRVARRSDFLARLGGEELGVILPETDRAGAVVIAERFRKAVEATPWPLRQVTVSVGATTVDFHQAVPRPEVPGVPTILTEADRALYQSKHLGRNRSTHLAETTQSCS